MALREFRRNTLTKPIFTWAKDALPPLSETEREALHAGDVWWDAELFSGDPNWSKLLNTQPAKLSEDERAFLGGPCDELCALIDDWTINWELGDLPEDVWRFLKENRFFGMIIPKEWGG